jgi:hypothetical protein
MPARTPPAPSAASAVPHPKTADLAALLDALVAARVEFIVVGGAAAVLHGAPITTQDLDIVHRRTPENVHRLLAVLDRLDAVVRDPAGRRLRPQQEHLLGQGQLNLLTSLGPLDPLCQLHDGRGFEELLPRTTRVTDGAISIDVLDLPTLIEVKTAAGRARDRLVVPVLLALLADQDDG